MVLKWEPLARKRMKEITKYYIEVAGVQASKRIRAKIVKTANDLLVFAKLGPIEPLLENITPYIYRYIVAHRNYKIIYRIEGEVIFIFTIWDCRRDPDKMKEEE